MRSMLFPLFLASACGTSFTSRDVPSADASPHIQLRSPRAGDFVAGGPTAVHGIAPGLDLVTVNGKRATMDGEAFTADVHLVRGVNVIEAHGVDAEGDAFFVREHVVAGDIRPAAGVLDDALRIRVNESGLNAASGLLGSAVDPSALGLASMNPVYEDSYGVWGIDFVAIEANIADVRFAPPQLQAQPTPGWLQFAITLPDLVVEADIDAEIIGIDVGFGVDIGASAVTLSGRLSLDAVGGKLDADARDLDLTLDGFWYDISFVPDAIEKVVLVDQLRTAVQGMLREAVRAEVPAALKSALSDLELSFDLELLDTPAHVDARFDEARVDADGILLGLGLDVWADGVPVNTAPGHLAATGGVPQLSRDEDIALAVSDDLMNRLLFHAWAAGVLDRTLSTDDGTLPAIALMPLGAQEGSIVVHSALPPVLAERDGTLQAQLGELGVSLQTPGGELGDHLDLAIAAFLDLELALGDGTLALELGSPDLSVVVRDSDWGASDEATTHVVEELLPLELFVGLLGDIEIPIPELGGLESADIEVKRTPAYTVIEMAL